MTRLTIKTDRREQMIDITSKVARVVADSGAGEGVVHVFCTHTTAGVTINENADPDVKADLLDGLRRLAPQGAAWLHTEGNSDAHLKSTLVGASATVPFEGGRLALGTWQAVYFSEFDGPRTRNLLVSVVAG
jgi:secondary thiamine-phosphate synthase enzyme